MTALNFNNFFNSNSNQNFKIGFYIRVSTDAQGLEKNPEGSIKNQEQRLNAFVQLKGEGYGQVVGTFIDDGISAKDTNRPELQRLFRAVENKEVDLVVVSELSRISRNMKDFADIWEMFKEYGCKLISIKENFDTSTAAGEMMVYNMANLAQFERRQTSERVIASRFDRATRGLYSGGALPLGYKTISNKPGYIKIDEAEAETVKAAFDAYLREGSISSAAKWLNARNYKPAREIVGGGQKARVGHFTIGGLKAMLKNWIYAGYVDYKRGNERAQFPAKWEAIIDLETFKRVQKQLGNNHYARVKPQSDNRYPYTLSGLTYCGVCGDNMCGKSGTGRNKKYGYYEHSWAMRKNSTLTKKVFTCDMAKRIPARKLEPVVHDIIEKILSDENFSKELVEEASKIHRELYSVESQIRSVKRELSSYNAQLEAITERIAKMPSDLSADLFYEQIRKVKKHKEKAEKKLRSLKTQSDIGSDLPTALKDYLDFNKLLKTFWSSPESTPKIKASIIKKLINKIKIFPNRIEVEYFMGSNKIKRESVLISDSLFHSRQVSDFTRKEQIFSFRGGSRTCHSGAPTSPVIELPYLQIFKIT